MIDTRIALVSRHDESFQRLNDEQAPERTSRTSGAGKGIVIEQDREVRHAR